MSAVRHKFIPTATRPRDQRQLVLPPPVLLGLSSEFPPTKRAHSVARDDVPESIGARTSERVLGRLAAELAQTRAQERQKIANDRHPRRKRLSFVISTGC